MLAHGRVPLALHTLRSGAGPTLLVLHGLGERTAPEPPPKTVDWPGSIHGLDFTGHGESGLPIGGGYAPEWLAADADVALAHLGPLSVWGIGLGGYVALLLLGSRPGDVGGIVIADGPGLVGGDDVLTPALVGRPTSTTTPDPTAIAELSIDRRPAVYAIEQHEQVLAADPNGRIVVCAAERPQWLGALIGRPGVIEADTTDAIGRLQVGPL